MMDNLILELKKSIKEQLNLEDISLDEINVDDPMFGEGLGLDSIDALELIVMMDKNYGIKISDPEQGKTVFRSIRTMAGYIMNHRVK